MGNKWTVTVAVWKNDGSGSYEYRVYWCGELLEEALSNLYQAKRDGYQCITLQWRP